MPELPEKRNEVVIDGKRLETLSYAPISDRPTIVMLHEGLGSVSMWKDFPERLADASGCGVLAYSRYGHGKSERICAKRTVRFMDHEGTVVLPALLERLGIHRPILLGHSDGASICIVYAGADASLANRPQALILEAPHVFVEDVTVQSIAKIGGVYETTDLPSKLARHHDGADEMFWGWNDIWLDPAFRGWSIEDRLDAIRCPLLVIQGEEDEYGTLAQLATIKRRVPQTQSLVLANCGHSPHRDQLEVTLEAISQFLRKLL